jgi:hypothetical protein
MRGWLALLPALGVMLGGCARESAAPALPAAPGPQPPQASIVFASPSPAGDQVVIGTLSGRLPMRGPGGGSAWPPDALWLIGLRTGQARQLPPELISMSWGLARAVHGSELTWRPDGGAVAAVTSEQRIAVFDCAGEAARVISPEDMRCRRPAWSPDGKRLLVEANTEDGTPFRSRTAGASARPGLYSLPADGRVPPRFEGAGRSDLWYWNADIARQTRQPRARSAASATPGQRVLDQIRRANVRAYSPDRQYLAYSGTVGRYAAVIAVVDRSLTPLLVCDNLDAPAGLLLWSPDGTKLLGRTSRRQTHLLDLTARTAALVDDPVLSDREPVGWVRWNGKWQLAFIDETWKRLVITEKIGAPVYTLVTTKQDATPVLALPVPKEN